MGRFLNSAIIGVGLLCALPAFAEKRSDRDARNWSTPNQLVDQADARIATLKADLHLTPDEDKNWSGFQAALHDIAVRRAEEWDNLRKQRTETNTENGKTSVGTNPVAGSPPANNTANADAELQNPLNDAASSNPKTGSAPDEIRALRDEADRFNRRADELKKIADAGQPLYESLDESQRHQLMTFIRSIEPENQNRIQKNRRGRR